jgi:hypothetical protein
VLAALPQPLKGAGTGLSIGDAKPLAVCHNLRNQRRSIFQGIGRPGQPVAAQLVVRLFSDPSEGLAGPLAWDDWRACAHPFS